MEKIIKNLLSNKLGIQINGNELELDLNNRNINNMTLKLLSSIEFKYLEELDLSKNNISDANILKEFIFNKLKKLNLSSNKINPLTNKNKIQESFFRKTSININLDNNNLNKKDIENIKNEIMSIDKSYKKNYYNTYSKDNFNDKDITPNEKQILIDKLNMLEKKVLDYFSIKFNFYFTRNEIKIYLDNKNIFR